MSFKSQIVQKAVDVTPDTPYSESQFLYIGSSGDLRVVQPDGTNTTYVGLAIGIWHPIASTMIIDSGTTADEIKVGY